MNSTIDLYFPDPPKSDEERLRRIQLITADQLSIEPHEVTLESDFIEDLGADSLDVVEIIMKIELLLQLNVNDETASEISSVQEALDYSKNQEFKAPTKE